MKGCYCLIIYVKKLSKIKIGKQGEIKFKKGTYVYIGSAMNSLESRLKRHLSNEKKTALAHRLPIKKQKCKNCRNNLQHFNQKNRMQPITIHYNKNK